MRNIPDTSCTENQNLTFFKLYIYHPEVLEVQE